MDIISYVISWYVFAVGIKFCFWEKQNQFRDKDIKEMMSLVCMLSLSHLGGGTTEVKHGAGWWGWMKITALKVCKQSCGFW